MLTGEAIEAYFGAQEKISIDYALMEPASREGNVAVSPFETDWSDVGTWGGRQAPGGRWEGGSARSRHSLYA